MLRPLFIGEVATWNVTIGKGAVIEGRRSSAGFVRNASVGALFDVLDYGEVIYRLGEERKTYLDYSCFAKASLQRTF